METDQGNKPSSLPSKLRWRPYANGTSKKTSKFKKQDTVPNPKATAHKVRGQQYYSSKSASLPTGIKLQWEEAETVESMSHGGHQHDHHSSDHSRGSSPSASSDTSSISHSSRDLADANRGIGHTSSMQRAMASLPSPPLSSFPTRLDLVGGHSDFSQFKASVSDLATGGNNFFQNGLSLNSMASETAYQIAFNALLQSQNMGSSLFHTPAIMGSNLDNPSTFLLNNNNSSSGSSNGNSNNKNINNSKNNNIAAASAASNPASTLLGSSNINSMLLSDPNKALSSQDLLGVASIDELLVSCGFKDGNVSTLGSPAIQMLSSATDTNQPIDSSPINSLLNFSNPGFNSKAASPSPVSFSPMAIANVAFEALLAQPISSQQTAPQQPISNDPYEALMMELTAPFGYLSTNGDSSLGLNSTPTAWPSLFPASLDDQPTLLNRVGDSVATSNSSSQRSERATQTDGSYESPLSPISARASSVSHGSPLSSIDAIDEELDPDWLNFLDEASEVFNEISMPSPPHSGDEEGISESKATQKDRSMWNWAEQLLKPSPGTPTSSYSFPTSGSMSSIPSSTVGNSSLIRTLHTTPQKNTKTNSSTKISSTKTESKDTEVDSKTTTSTKEATKEDIKAISIESKDNIKVENANDSLSIIEFFKSLFIGGSEKSK